MRKFLLDMRKDFLIMSNFYLVEIPSEPNSLTIVTSKKMLKTNNYVLILRIFFSQNENQEFALYKEGVSYQDICGWSPKESTKISWTKPDFHVFLFGFIIFFHWALFKLSITYSACNTKRYFLVFNYLVS